MQPLPLFTVPVTACTAGLSMLQHATSLLLRGGKLQSDTLLLLIPNCLPHSKISSLGPTNTNQKKIMIIAKP